MYSCLKPSGRSSPSGRGTYSTSDNVKIRDNGTSKPVTVEELRAKAAAEVSNNKK